jgi:anti-anti-sigma factor
MHGELNRRRTSEVVKPTIEVDARPRGAAGVAAIVRLGGEHDLATVVELRDILRGIDGHVLVDLSDCLFIDSSVIATLISEAGERRTRNERLELVVPSNGLIGRTLEIVGIPALLIVHDRVPDSTASSGER